jgi:hypothetical protein
MKRYCIFLTTDLKSVEDFRRRYDPLATKVPPHVTLVHPFESDQPLSAIITHLKKTFWMKKPAFAVGDPVWIEGYIHLPVRNEEEKLEQQRVARDWQFKKTGTFQSMILENILEDESSKTIYSHSIVAGGLEEMS